MRAYAAHEMACGVRGFVPAGAAQPTCAGQGAVQCMQPPGKQQHSAGSLHHATP